MALEREDLQFFTELIREDIKGVHVRLDALNGKTNRNTTDIAVLQSQQEQNNKSMRNQSVGWGTGAGAFVGGLIIAVYQYFSK